MNILCFANKKLSFFVWLLCLLFPTLLRAQPLLTDIYNRNISSLNGSWNYIVDPYETGYYNYRHQPYDQADTGSHAAFFNNYHAKDKSELVEYDFDRSPLLYVPGDWNSQKESLLYYEGTIWFKRSFNYRLTDKSNRLFLYFGAVNYKADLYLNGKKLGTHEGGFTPFNFEITGIVQPENNFLVVKVDNTRSKEAVPTNNTDWWNYGGIARDVLLVEEPAVLIRDFKIQLKKGDSRRLSGFVQLDNVRSTEKVSINIPELGIEQNFMTNSNGYAQFEFSINKLQYWSPETPKLYEVVFKTNYQKLKDEIGFRTITTSGPNILLNGKPIFLRGISIHEENGMRGGRAYSPADAMVLLGWAKELGCNYVRLAHYPHNEYMVQLAEKMGLMVWEEIPVYWTIDFNSGKTLANAKKQLEDMIVRDKNRASVIIWSMANETPPSESRNAFLTELIKIARTMDSTRLLSAALERRGDDARPGINIIDDKIGEQLDIVAFNQYTGWYGGSLEKAPEAKWEIAFNKPVVVSEFGGGALQGKYGDRSERWTEEYQEYLYQQNIRMIEKIPHISGMSPWILADFRSPKRLLSGIQDGWNRKGLLSNRGIKKKAFYVLQDFYKRVSLPLK